MELEDVKLFDQISKKAEFHSALMTSFSVDLNHFENQVLRSFRQKGITNVSLLVDERMLNDNLGYSTGKLQYVNSLYSVDTIHNKSVFHPKLSFFAGDHEVMLLQGSGNITSGGHGKNHEMFSVLYATEEDKRQLPLILEAWHYLKKIAENVKGFSEKKILWIEENCALLNDELSVPHSFHNIDEDSQVAILYNDESGIFSQLTELIPADEIQKISIVSPFYDESGALLNALSEYFQQAKIDVFLSGERSVHPHKMLPNPKISFFDWDSTGRSKKKFKSYQRIQHSKVFLLESKLNSYCLIGSANATVSAFGTLQTRGVNDEFAVLHKTSKTDFLSQLGLSGDITHSIPKKMDAANKIAEVGTNTYHLKYKINGADFDENGVQIFFVKGPEDADINLAFFNVNGEIILKHKSHLKNLAVKVIDFPLKLRKMASYVQVFDEDSNAVSNKYLLNQVSDLWNTNPSKENRRLQRLISSIEAGDFSGTQLIEFLNQIHSERERISTSLQQVSLGNSDAEHREKNVDSGLSYREAIEAQNNVEQQEIIPNKHHSVKIWEAIDFYLKNYALENQDENDDEEEEGDATESRTRKESNKLNKIQTFNSVKVLESRRNSILKFLTNYCGTLERIANNEKLKIGLIDISMLLIALHQLGSFANQKIFLNDDKRNDVLFPVEGCLADLDNYCGAALNILGKFTNIYTSTEWIEYKDEYGALKLSQYKEICCLRSLFSLAIIKDHYWRFDKFHKWIDVMAFNSLNIFGKPSENMEKTIENLVAEIHFDEISSYKIKDSIDNWLKTYQLTDFNEEIFKNPKTGFTIINKRVPFENPKFLKLSRPGFEFNVGGNDFISEDLFSLESEIWFKSKNSLTKA